MSKPYRLKNSTGRYKGSKDAPQPAADAPWMNLAILCAILGGALIIRLLYSHAMGSDLFAHNLIIDAKFYDTWAQEILNGTWRGKDPFYQDPLYAYFLAGCYWIFGHDIGAIRNVQIFLDIGTLTLIYTVGTMLYHKRAGLIAAAIGALYGPMVYFTCILDKTTLTTFLIALGLAALIYACRTSIRIHFFSSGLVIGLAALARGNMLIAATGICFWLCIIDADIRPLATRIKNALAFSCGVLCLVSLVSIRNYWVSGDFVLLTSNAGLNFFIGNNARTSGNYLEPPFIHGIPEEEYSDSKITAEQIAGRKITKASEVSRFWWSQGLAFIASSPSRWAALILKKIFLIGNSFEIPETYSFYYFKNKYGPLQLAPFTFWVIFSLGIAGASRFRSAQPNALHVYSVIYFLSLSMFFVTARYRFPLIIPLIVFSGWCLSEIYELLSAATFKAVLGYLLGIVALALFSNWEPAWMSERVVKPGLSTPHTIAGFMFRSMGKPGASIKELEIARKINPHEPNVYAYMADAYLELGQSDKALPLLLQAVRLNPAFHEALNNIGTIYYDQKNYSVALRAFQAALSIRPNDETYMKNYERARLRAR